MDDTFPKTIIIICNRHSEVWIIMSNNSKTIIHNENGNRAVLNQSAGSSS